LAEVLEATPVRFESLNERLTLGFLAVSQSAFDSLQAIM